MFLSIKRVYGKSGAGFTIIELIVVIAIIAVLAAIVLVNVTGYINKAKDARIKSDMGNIKLGMVACYGANKGTTYAGCYVDPAYIPVALKSDITAQGGTSVVSSESATAYCVSVKLNSGSYVCVDSTGVTKEGTQTCNAGASVCMAP